MEFERLNKYIALIYDRIRSLANSKAYHFLANRSPCAMANMCCNQNEKK